MIGSYAGMIVRIDDVSRSGEEWQRTLMSSSRSRMASWMARYSSASFCCTTLRSPKCGALDSTASAIDSGSVSDDSISKVGDVSV